MIGKISRGKSKDRAQKKNKKRLKRAIIELKTQLTVENRILESELS